MIIKRRVTYLFLFFLLNNTFFVHAVDLTVPGSGGAEVAKAVSSVVQHVVTGPAGESLLRLLAKSFIPWVPAVAAVGGISIGGFFLTKYTLALGYRFFNNISESIDNVTNAPSRIKDILNKIKKVKATIKDILTKLCNLKDDVTEFRGDFNTRNTAIQAKITQMQVNMSTIDEKIDILSKEFKGDNAIIQEKIVEIQHNTIKLSNVLDSLSKQNSTQHNETLQQVQQSRTDFKDLKDCFNIIAQQNIETKQFTEEQSKLLMQIFKMLADIQLNLEDVPKHVIETKEAFGNMIESKQRAESAQQNNTTATTTTLVQLTGNRGMSGSGIFTTVIEPKMNKFEETIQENKKEINQALEKVKEENFKRKNEEAKLLEEVISLKNSVQQLLYQNNYRYNEQEKELVLFRAFFCKLLVDVQKQKQLEQNIASVTPISIGSTQNYIPNIDNKRYFLPMPTSPYTFKSFTQQSNNDSVYD